MSTTAPVETQSSSVEGSQKAPAPSTPKVQASAEEPKKEIKAQAYSVMSQQQLDEAQKTLAASSQTQPADAQTPPAEASQPFFVAAQTTESLRNICNQLIDGVDRREKEIADDKNLLRRVAHGLAASQEMHMPIIRSFTADSLSALRSQLQHIRDTPDQFDSPPPRSIILVLAGQFGNKIMSKEIYDSSAIMRWHLDECDRAVKKMGLNSLYPSIFVDNVDIKNVVESNCRLFAIQYASARTWMDSGLQVSAVMGYSFGQITSWAISGILSLGDALKIVAGRAKAIQERCSNDGAMIGVMGEWKRIRAALAALEILHPGEKLETACVSGPGSYVLVGRESSVAALESMLPTHEFCGKSLRHKRIEVTHGFHSELMEPMLDDLRRIASEVEYFPPKLHFEACSETPQASVGPDELVRHTRGAVHFEAAINRLSQKFGDCAWVEVDAGQSTAMTNMMRRIVGGADRARDSFHACNMDPGAGLKELAQVSVGLWKEGISVQHWAFHRSRMQEYLPIALPAYQFARRARRRAMNECVAVHESLATVKLGSPIVRAAKAAVQDSLRAFKLDSPAVQAAKEAVQESLESLKAEAPDADPSKTTSLKVESADAEAPKNALQESLASLKLEAPDVEAPKTAVEC